TANPQRRAYGASDPAFTAALSGFRHGETLANSGVTGSPAVSTTATPSSLPGDYTLTVSQGNLAAGNYDFTRFVNGTLTVTPPSVLPITLTRLPAGGDPTAADGVTVDTYVGTVGLADL